MKDDETLAALVAEGTRELELELADRRQAEDALRVSEVRYRRLFEGAKDGILILDAETGMILDVNPFLMELLGLSQEAFLGKQLWELGSFKDIAANRDKFLELQQKGYVRYEDLPMETAQGRRVRVEFVSNVYLADKQKVIQCNIRDITERKLGEEKLATSEERFRSIFVNAPVGIYRSTVDRLIFVNPAMAAMFGYGSPAEMIAAAPRPEGCFVLPEQRQHLVREAMESEAYAEREVLELRKDGSIFTTYVRMRAVRDEAGNMTFLEGFVEDITQRKELEAKLRQAQKMEAIGQLAGGVAHDFNNILAAIILHLSLLRENPSVDAQTQESLKELTMEAQRAAALTRQLLIFSRRSVLAFKVFDLNELAANLLKMLRRLIGENIAVQFDQHEALPPVNADPGMIEQVLMNLAVNARDAMPGGGRLTISTKPIRVDAEQIKGKMEVQAGQFVCLVVADTGTGMDEATLKRIFEPFFTTKEPGKGTGLGLATVYGIVAQHKGWVEVESEVGKGTKFKVFLPATAQSTKEPTPTGKLTVVRGHETILLVEDESSLRRVVGQVLRQLGYRVLEAGNGQAAMTCWQEASGHIDLLFSDMVMPEGLSGLDLAETFRREKPNLKIIISSGYNPELAGQSWLTKGRLMYLQKPYPIELMSKMVRECLDQK